MTTKKCKDCGECKPIELFGKNKNETDGFAFYCKSCKSKRDSANYKAYQAKKKEKVSEYRLNNKEIVKEAKRKEYLKNKDKYLKRSKDYYVANKEKISIDNRIRFQRRDRQITNEKERNKKQTDVGYRIKCNLRSRLSIAIRNDQKKGSAIRDLGCSIEFLKEYLENLFLPGMSWDNYGRLYGKWNIDHILPLASFDLTNREHFLKACNYTNLQPLWYIDNMRKGKTILK